MEPLEDYAKYLSIDNGRGLLFSKDDAMIMDFYKIDYRKYVSMRELIMVIGQFIDDHYDEDLEDLEEVLDHLMENHYYFEVNK